MADHLEALESLEKRIEALELKIVGNVPLDDVDTSKVKPVLKSLYEVDTALIMTLSGREKAAALLKKVDILETIMDPLAFDAKFNLDAKVETILASETDLLKFRQQLLELDRLKPVLESDGLEQLLAVSDRLNKLSTDILNVKEKCDSHTSEVRTLFAEYIKAILDLSQLFVDVESLVTKLEIESQPKQSIE